MTGLQKPPSSQQPSSRLARFVLIVFLASLAAVLGATLYLSSQADSSEGLSLADIERPNAIEVNGVTLNLARHPGGPSQVVLIHDDEVTGMLTLEALGEGLPGGFSGTRIDLPGFGLSDRVPEESPLHTVGGVSGLVADAIDQTFSFPVILVGVGYGGEVAVEVAATHPELIRGVVMVDTDFGREPSVEENLQSAPLISKAAVFLWETGGPLAVQMWAPDCETGGWCPSDAQLSARRQIVAIADTTASFEQFRMTPPSAIGGSSLDELSMPVGYVWSNAGPVGKDVVDRFIALNPDLTLIESQTSAAHLLDVAAIASAVEAVGS